MKSFGKKVISMALAIMSVCAIGTSVSASADEYAPLPPAIMAVLRGDVTADGEIDIEDLGRMQQYVAGWGLTRPYFYIEAADMNGDGKVNKADETILGYQICGHVFGDVNGDGKVTKNDQTRLARYLSGWNVRINKEMSDMNGDRRINIEDLLLFQRKYSNGFFKDQSCTIICDE